MRLVLVVGVLILAVSFAGFMVENLDRSVEVTVWSTTHEQVHLGIVVLITLLVGVVFTAIIAIAEGAKIRLENRRLRRDMHQLETEINYLRTQPPLSPPREPDSIESTRAPAPAGRREPLDPPSAPVYESDDGWDGDTDDDVYSGGRAV